MGEKIEELRKREAELRQRLDSGDESVVDDLLKVEQEIHREQLKGQALEGKKRLEEHRQAEKKAEEFQQQFKSKWDERAKKIVGIKTLFQELQKQEQSLRETESALDFLRSDLDTLNAKHAFGINMALFLFDRWQARQMEAILGTVRYILEREKT